MNPLVSQMLDATISNDVETRFLEDLFEQHVGCEARNHEGRECTGTITYLHSNCQFQQLVCTAKMESVRGYINLRGENWCQGCGKLGKKCWTIRPI